MWQKCSICNGSGKEDPISDCRVCNGERIISELTGLPPVKPKKVNIDDLEKKNFNYLVGQIPAAVFINPNSYCTCSVPFLSGVYNVERICGNCLRLIK